jgi:capsular polysaccharide biosynthesis protein
MTDRPHKFKDEIELIDYLRVIWKWRYLILVGTIVCTLTITFVSLAMPKIYRIDTVLQPGVVGIDKNGNNRYIDSPANIKTLIEAGTLNSEIIDNLKKSSKNNLPILLRLEVNIPKNSNLVRISYETDAVDVGINILNNIAKILPKKYVDKVNYIKNEYEAKLRLKRNRLSFLEKKKEITKRNINYIRNLQEESTSELKVIDNDSNLLIKQRSTLMNKKKENNDLKILLYNNIIQENFELKNKYKNHILDYVSKSEEEKLSLKEIQEKIEIETEEIENLQKQKDNIQAMQVLQPPTVSPHPIKPETGRNVMLGTPVALLGMLLLAFFLEYLSKYRGNDQP